MIREGQGKAPPAPIAVQVPHSLYTHYRDLAIQQEQRNRYSSSSRAWCRGHCARPTFTGFMGEAAFCLFVNQRLGKFGINLHVDEQPRKGGDGGIDFNIDGVSIQLKTRQRAEVVLVRREDERGNLLPIVWQVIVSATWKDLTDHEPNHTVFIDGWLSKKNFISKSKLKDARRGDHMNLELPDIELEPMCQLLSYFRSRQKRKEKRV